MTTSQRGMRVCQAIALAVALGWASAAFAGFTGTDVFLPSVGSKPGVPPSVWYTTVWVHNPTTSNANITVYLLERGMANTSPLLYTDTIPPGDTRKFDDAVQTMFSRQTFGALRITSNVKVIVSSRIYSQAAGAGERDSVGQFFAAVPASFAIGLGESSELLGVSRTVPTSGASSRYNYGYVETTGQPCTVHLRVMTDTGTQWTFQDHQVQAWEQNQFSFDSQFPMLGSADVVRLSMEVTSGAGKVVVFGSRVANGSQDPSTFEMSYKDSLLAENSTGGGSIAGVTAGAGLSGGGTTGTVTLNVGAGDGVSVAADTVGLADGGVTAGKIATGQVVKSVNGLKDGVTLAAGSNVTITPSGQTLTIAATPGGGGGDITAVTAGAGLSGGGASGDVSLSVANGGITSGMIADGTVAAGDVGFNYAASSTKGGAATDLACSGCVVASELSPSGGSNGKVLKHNGSAVAWGDDAGGLTLPYAGVATTSGEALRVSNTGSGVAINGATSGGSYAVYGQANTGTGVGGASGSGTGVFGTSVSADGVKGTTDGSGKSGVYGANTSTSGYGVYGRNTGNGFTAYLAGPTYPVNGTRTTGTAAAVYGASSAANGTGVAGTAHIGGAAFGIAGFSLAGIAVYGESTGGGKAGRFVGNVDVTGTLTKGGGSFKIDHPLAPGDKYLSHSFVESPDMMNVYNGNVVLDDAGEAWVELPEWFEALNREFRYQLTAIGTPGPNLFIANEIAGNRFRIAGGARGSKVSWQVTGIRHDPWANAHRIPVEEAKPVEEIGTYLHAEEAGQPERRSVEWLHRQSKLDGELQVHASQPTTQH